MAHSNELTEIALQELKLRGIIGTVRDTNGGHIEVSWQADPTKQVRQVFCAKTPGDWRAKENVRHIVRRSLRADNVPLKIEIKPKKAALTKALEIPKNDTIPVPDLIASMRGEIADLGEMIHYLAKFIIKGQQAQKAVDAVVEQHFPAPPSPAPVVEARPSRTIKMVTYLTQSFVSLDAIMNDIKEFGLSRAQILQKLYYLEARDKAERDERERWRLKIVPKFSPSAMQKKLNGKGKAKSNGAHH